ncbi:MAG: Zn-ribbon domain-containing OB-fold protein [Acidimicrobiia bacterium]
MADQLGPMRVPPLLTELNRDYWTGGLSGELRILRCQACGHWLHPPTSICRECLSTDIAAEAVSGKGTVAAFTINHQQWSPTATADPYIIAIVELPEQANLRQTTNIVNCGIREVFIGMAVRVVFEPLEDVAVPLFEPDR